jgi:hypothetical protein
VQGIVIAVHVIGGMSSGLITHSRMIRESLELLKVFRGMDIYGRSDSSASNCILSRTNFERLSRTKKDFL